MKEKQPHNHEQESYFVICYTCGYQTSPSDNPLKVIDDLDAHREANPTHQIHIVKAQ